jgi:hypothetical protein
MTAKEFMMGYESPLTTLGNTLLPHWIRFDRVGLIDRVSCARYTIMINISTAVPIYYQMYDFDGDFETFYTGDTDNSMSGLYDTFRGSQNLPHWEGDHCSSIQGASDGTKFKSFISDNDTLLFFRKSMCRPQRLVSLIFVQFHTFDLYLHFFSFFLSLNINSETRRHNKQSSRP